MGGKGLLDDSQKLLEKGKATVQEGVDMIISGDISTGLAMVDKGKQTTQTGADKAEDELSTEEDEASRTLDVLFNAFQNQHYGFDGQYGQSALQPQYESLTHKDGTYYIAWKSVIKGATDQVIAIADNKKTDTTQTTYRFKTAEGLPVNTTALPDTGKYKLNLTNNTTAGETYIEAHKTIPAADSGQSPTTRLAGHLNLAVYEGESFTLQLVPMGDASCLPAQVQTALNDIYQQAAVTWQVSAYQKDFSPTGWDEDEDGLVKSAETQFLSNYTSEMNNIIDAFKKQANPDRKTYYLFLVPGFSDDLAGFMPLCRNYGFIATENATTIANTIGHELGHGAFVLYHPFSDKSPYYRPEGSTDNLMDYSGGTFLNKYQWDLINDPRRIVRVMQDEGEGEKQLVPDPVCTQKFIENFRWAYVNNQKLNYPDNRPFGHYANDLKLLDNNVYTRVHVDIYDDIGLKPIKEEYQKNYGRAEIKIGKVLQISSNDKYDNFFKYLFPSKSEFKVQMNALKQKIANENKRERLLELLAILPNQEYKKLTIDQKLHCIKIIAENFNLTRDVIDCINDERICLQLLKDVTTRINQEKLLKGILNKKFIFNLIDQLQGDEKKDLIFTISEYIYAVYLQPAHWTLVSQEYMNNTGTYSKEIQLMKGYYKGIYESNCSQLNGNFHITVYDKIGINKSLVNSFYLDPYEYVSLTAAESFPEYNLQKGDKIVVPAPMLHWILTDYKNKELASDFIKIIDMGFSIATIGSYAAGKVSVKAGTKVSIAMAMDLVMQTAIISLDPEKDFNEAFRLTDMAWSGASSLINNDKLKIAVGCIRSTVKEGIKNNDNIENAIENGLISCGANIISNLVSNRLISDNGKLYKKFEKTFKDNPEGVFSSLYEMGFTPEIIVDITKDFADNTLLEIINNIALEYETKQ